jgi:hypothetical protein
VRERGGKEDVGMVFKKEIHRGKESRISESCKGGKGGWTSLKNSNGGDNSSPYSPGKLAFSFEAHRWDTV